MDQEATGGTSPRDRNGDNIAVAEDQKHGTLLPPALVAQKSATAIPSVSDVTAEMDDSLVVGGSPTPTHDSGALPDDRATTAGGGDDDELQEMLSGLISQRLPGDLGTTPSRQERGGFLEVKMFPSDPKITSETEYFSKYIRQDRNSERFEHKLKQFFILSAAGKPIYSLNGKDDAVMGYLGIITTLISTFQEGLGEQLQTVTIGGESGPATTLVVMSVSPLYFVAISQLVHETTPLLGRQLTALYSYLLAILSRPTIDRNFQNRMNYDLRKVLTPLDYLTLDSLCMTMTYGYAGVWGGESDEYATDIEFFMSFLLNSAVQSVKVSKTVRSKINSIVVSSKRLKRTPQDDDNSSLFSFLPEPAAGTSPSPKNLAEELLFAVITSGTNKIISYVRPKTHHLSNEDLSMLFAMISTRHDANDSSRESWIPICMPRFNANGFLYAYIRQFEIGLPPQPFNIVLFSGNKNTFYEMQQVSRYIIHRFRTSETLKSRLHQEVCISDRLSISRDIKVPHIKHFAYKSKKYNQFIMSNPENLDDVTANLKMQMAYYYSTLYHSKSTLVYAANNRKFSYMRWLGGMTGFMLLDDTSEFYCLCDEAISSQDLIRNCLKIIKWCEENHARLFMGAGDTF
ncbi:vacuolar fusion protein Mon1p [Diutina catenulata]